MDEEDVVPMLEVEHEGLVVCCHLGVGNPDEQVEGASGGLALEAIDRLDSAQAVVHPLPDSAAMAIEPAPVSYTLLTLPTICSV